MSQTLRDYQQEAVCAVLSAQEAGWRSVLVTQATGTGKTTVAAELVRRALCQGKRVLFVAHTQELIGQALKSLQRHCDLDEFDIAPEINVATAPHSCRIVVGSLMTIKNPERLSWFRPDVVIYDEAHRCGSATHKAIKALYPGAFHVGVTATPKRGDRQALHAFHLDNSPVMVEKDGVPAAADLAETIFEKHVFAYGLRQAQRDGWIVPFKWLPVPTKTDLSSVKVGKDGDYTDSALSEKLDDDDDRTVLLINAWKQVAADCPTLMFCTSVVHAVHSTLLFRQAGIHAECIVSKEPELPEHKAVVTVDSSDRFRIIEDFKRGKFPVLVNYGTLTEGVDVPNCSCIIRARPTTVWALLCQIIGRGGRPLPGTVDGLETAIDRLWAIETSAKPHCLIIEPQDIHGKHDPARLPDILDLPAGVEIEDLDLKSARALLAEEKEKQREAEGIERKKREQAIAPLVVGFAKKDVTLSAPVEEIHTEERSAQIWVAGKKGYSLQSTKKGYEDTLREIGADRWAVTVTAPDGETIFNKQYKFDREKHETLTKFINQIAVLANKRIEDHSDMTERRDKMESLTRAERWHLERAGISYEQAAAMGKKELVGKLVSLKIGYQADKMKAKREQAQQAQQQGREAA